MKVVLRITLWFFALLGLYSFIIAMFALKQEAHDRQIQMEQLVEAIDAPALSASESDSSRPLDLPVEPVEIAVVPTKNLPTSTPAYYGEVSYREGDKLRQLSYHDRWIQSLQFSPQRSKLGFFYQSSDWRDISLVIMDLRTRSFREIYRGDYRTGGWHWLNNSEALVTNNCGTGCESTQRINAQTGKATHDHAVFYNQGLVSQKTNILWKYDSGQVLFYNSVPELIFSLPVSKLVADSDPSAFDNDPARLIDVQSAVLDSQGQIYFLAALHSCGQNCSYTLYRIDTKTDNVTPVKTNLFGGEIKLFLSGDSQHLAVVGSVEGGVCNTGAYIYIIDTKSLAALQIKGFDWPGSTAAYVQSASWKNNDEFQFSLTQSKCAGPQRGDRDSEYSYTVSGKKLRLLKEEFLPDSNG